MELDLPRLLATLDRHNVAYVLIGGLAAVYHGSPFPTEDADITPDTDDANLDRLASALRELNARIRTEAVPEGVPFACDAAGLAASETWNLVTDVGDLDISFRPSGTRGYPDLRRDAVSADIYDVTVQIASLADVIRSKQAANRPKDQRVLPTLREILARRRACATVPVGRRFAAAASPLQRCCAAVRRSAAVRAQRGSRVPPSLVVAKLAMPTSIPAWRPDAGSGVAGTSSHESTSIQRRPCR